MITKEILVEFRKYCDTNQWTFDDTSSEFTFQFRFGWFLHHFFNNKYIVDFEVNVKKYVTSSTIKKEIDVLLIERGNNSKHAIELKFIKDRMGYDLSLYKMCEDINFLEELREVGGFVECWVLAFSIIPNSYSVPKRKYNVTGDRKNFYKMFREDKRISGTVYGNKGSSIFMRKDYILDWEEFIGDIRVCIIKV